MRTHRFSQNLVCALVAASVFVSIAQSTTTARGETIDCAYDGYVAMGGMVFNTSNDYLLPANPDSPDQGGMQTFGYAFLKFDQGDLPGGTVQEALLQMEVMALQDGMTYPVAGTGNVGAFAVSADVAGIDGSTAATFRDSIAGAASDWATVEDSDGTGLAELVSLDVTDIVNDWITSGNNYGLVLASPGGPMPRIHSMESTTGLIPVIEIGSDPESVPEPTSVVLLLTALGALAVGARRRLR